MPIFEYRCQSCGKISEIITLKSEEAPPVCSFCNSLNIVKLQSPPAAFSGLTRRKIPGPSDTPCCGSSPEQAAGCTGPGSCCGKNSAEVI